MQTTLPAQTVPSTPATAQPQPQQHRPQPEPPIPPHTPSTAPPIPAHAPPTKPTPPIPQGTKPFEGGELLARLPRSAADGPPNSWAVIDGTELPVH